MATESPESINTHLSKIGRLYKDIDITDNVFHRINKDKLNDLYDATRDNIKKYDYLKKFMERKTFEVPSSKIAEEVMKRRLYNSHIRTALADSPSELETFLKPFIKDGRRSLVTKEKLEEAMLDKNKAETLLENENIITSTINNTYILFNEIIFLMSSIIKNIQLKKNG